MTPLDIQTHENTITTTSKSYLRSTGNWMRFVAIVYLIFAGLMALGTIGTIIGASALAGQMPVPIPSSAILGGSVAFLIFTALFFYVSLKLLQAGQGFRNYAETNSVAALENGLVNHKSYWLIMGVITIAVLVFMLIAGIAMASYLPMLLGGAL